MNKAQRAHYFRVLWPAACARQGWDAKNEPLRRDATLEATGKSSTGKLNQHEITLLFEWLKLQADPDNLDRAIPVANPDLSAEQDRCRQHLHVIGTLGFAEAYVERCAIGHCHKDGVSAWRDLSSAELEKLRHTLTTRARQRDNPDFEPRVAPYHRRESTRRKQRALREAPVLPRPGVAPLVESELMPF